MKEREIEFARLAAETDKMSMKSACEVRIELLVKEKEALILQMEEFKDIIQRQKDDMALEKIRHETDPEKESLKQQLKVLEQDQDTKESLREENQALYEKIQTLNAKINIVVTENTNLKEGQKKAIEEASKDRPDTTLFFKDEQPATRETQIDQITFKSI